MRDILKYPRTAHVRGSRLQHGDDDLDDVPWTDLVGKHLVVEEKVDGSNCGISFDDDGHLLLQSRGHYLRGGQRERQFDLFKQWAAALQVDLYCVLGSRYVMYGEWLFAKHTYFYDALPHYFMEFDVFDTETRLFLSTHARRALLAGLPIVPVRVLHEGPVTSMDVLREMVCRSAFITDDRFANLVDAALNAGLLPIDVVGHTDMAPEMEGLYLKWEEGGDVRGRYKFVRDTFTSAILDQEEHWHDRPIVQNRLLPGALERMFM